MPDVLSGLPWTALPLPVDASTGRAYVVTDGYGSRAGRHDGIDLATRDASGRPTTGLPVFSVTTAVVARIVDDDAGGLVVVLEDAEGSEVKYMHLTRALVGVGAIVRPGEQIATSGDSGDVSGPHLHLEAWVGGVAVDPAPLLDEAAALAGPPASKGSPALAFALLLGLSAAWLYFEASDLGLLERKKR